MLIFGMENLYTITVWIDMKGVKTMMKIIRNLGKIYAYCYKINNCMTAHKLSYKRRTIIDKNEVVLECEIIGIYYDSENSWIGLDFEKALEMLNIKSERPEYVNEALKYIKCQYDSQHPYGVETITIDGITYDKYALVITGKELERSEKDFEYLKKLTNEDAEHKINKAFVENSVNSILSKYGMKFNALEHEISWDNTKLSDLIIDYLNNTMIKELKEIGVDAELNTKILGQYSGHPLLNVPSYKRKFKINLKSEGGKQ
jgi:hypothetical protein